MDNNDEAVRRAEAVRAAHESELRSKANVLGVGVGLRQRDGQFTDEVALIVLVRQKFALKELAESDRIPQELDGIPVDVQEIGEPRALVSN